MVVVAALAVAYAGGGGVGPPLRLCRRGIIAAGSMPPLVETDVLMAVPTKHTSFSHQLCSQGNTYLSAVTLCSGSY